MANKAINDLLKYGAVRRNFTGLFNGSMSWTAVNVSSLNEQPLYLDTGNLRMYSYNNANQNDNRTLSFLYTTSDIRPYVSEGECRVYAYNQNGTYYAGASINYFVNNISAGAAIQDGSNTNPRMSTGLSIMCQKQGGARVVKVYANNVLLGTIASGGSYDSMDALVKWKILGSKFYYKYWLSGGSEPADYTYLADIDPSSLTGNYIVALAGNFMLGDQSVTRNVSIPKINATSYV